LRARNRDRSAGLPLATILPEDRQGISRWSGKKRPCRGSIGGGWSVRSPPVMPVC